MRGVLVALGMLVTAARADAQSLATVAGADVVRGAEYRGGHSGIPQGRKGTLVLNDSALVLFACRTPDCLNAAGTDWDQTAAVLTVPLASVRKVESSASRRGPSASSRALWGAFARDRNEGFVAVTFEVGGTVETPVFKTGDAVAPAFEEKIRFRVERRGGVLPP